MSKQSTIEEAMEAGERIAEEFNLGPIPSERLQEVMQDRFGILVLMVDAMRGISSGACRLPEFDGVLVARGEAPGRRNFDLARELFHILTWNEMSPKHMEQAGDFCGNRVEKLANNFASALLMPRAELEARADWAQLEMKELVAQLNGVADELGVTSPPPSLRGPAPLPPDSARHLGVAGRLCRPLVASRFAPRLCTAQGRATIRAITSPAVRLA